MTHLKKTLGVIQAHMIVKLVVRSTLQISAALTAKKTCAKLQLSFILATRQVAIIKLFPSRNWKQTLSSLLHPSYAKNTMINSVFLMRNVVMQFVGNASLLNTLVTCVYHLLKLPQSIGKEVKDLMKKTNVETGSAVKYELEMARLEKEVGYLQGLLKKVKKVRIIMCCLG